MPCSSTLLVPHLEVDHASPTQQRSALCTPPPWLEHPPFRLPLACSPAPPLWGVRHPPFSLPPRALNPSGPAHPHLPCGAQGTLPSLFHHERSVHLALLAHRGKSNAPFPPSKQSTQPCSPGWPGPNTALRRTGAVGVPPMGAPGRTLAQGACCCCDGRGKPCCSCCCCGDVGNPCCCFCCCSCRCCRASCCCSGPRAPIRESCILAARAAIIARLYACMEFAGLCNLRE